MHIIYAFLHKICWTFNINNMGCCCTKANEVDEEKHSRIGYFLDKFRLNTVSCTKIEKIEDEDYDLISYKNLCKKFKINIPFELFCKDNVIHSFELKIGLLLISKESYEKKIGIYDEMIKTDRQKMKFLEWQYQLINERMPLQLLKANIIENQEKIEWAEQYRLNAYQNLSESFKHVRADNPFVLSQLLSIA